MFSLVRKVESSIGVSDRWNLMEGFVYKSVGRGKGRRKGTARARNGHHPWAGAFERTPVAALPGK